MGRDHLSHDRRGPAGETPGRAGASGRSACIGVFPGRAEPLIWQAVVRELGGALRGWVRRAGLSPSARGLSWRPRGASTIGRSTARCRPASARSITRCRDSRWVSATTTRPAATWNRRCRSAPAGSISTSSMATSCYEQEDYAKAATALKRALAAPAHPDRPIWDAGRRAEARALARQDPREARRRPIEPPYHRQRDDSGQKSGASSAPQRARPVAPPGRVMRLGQRAARTPWRSRHSRSAPSDRVIELGCGPGHALRLVAALRPRRQRSPASTARPTMLDAGRRRAIKRDSAERPRAALPAPASIRCPSPRASFDKALAVNVAYFWQEPAPILAELRRVLRPGGRLRDLCYRRDDPAALALRRHRHAPPLRPGGPRPDADRGWVR